MSPPVALYCVSTLPVRIRKKHNCSLMERNKDKYPRANPQRQEHQNISHLPSSPCQLYNKSVYSACVSERCRRTMTHGWSGALRLEGSGVRNNEFYTQKSARARSENIKLTRPFIRREIATGEQAAMFILDICYRTGGCVRGCWGYLDPLGENKADPVWGSRKWLTSHSSGRREMCALPVPAKCIQPAVSPQAPAVLGMRILQN